MTAVFILRCLLFFAWLTGLTSVGRAFLAIFERPSVVTEGLSADSWVIASLLGLGTLSLLATLWRFPRSWRRPEAQGSLAPLRILFEIQVLGATAFFIFLQPFEQASWEIALGLSFSLWGVLLLAHLLWPRLGSARAIRAVDLMVFNLCLLAVLTEGGLRLVAHSYPSPLFAQAGERSAEVIRKRLKSHAPGQLRFGFPLNSRGHYDAEPEPAITGGRRIVMIGDSFSFGVVPHHYHFTSVAERHSELDVYNLGYPDIGPHEYLWLMRYQALPLAPDAVVVSLFVGNDVAGARGLGSRGGILETWFDRDRLLVYQLPPRLLRLWRERAAGGADRPVGTLPGEAVERRIETTQEMVATYPWLADPTLEQPTFILPGVFLEIERKRAERACDPQRADYSAVFEILREMRRLAGEVPFAVVLIPDEFQVDDELWAEILESRQGAALSRDQPQQLIGEWLAEEQIPYLDLLPVLRAECAPHHRGDSHCYQLRDTHFNARGNRVAGEALGRFFGRSLFSDREGSTL